MVKYPNIIKNVHIAIQSGDDEILKKKGELLGVFPKSDITSADPISVLPKKEAPKASKDDGDEDES